MKQNSHIYLAIIISGITASCNLNGLKPNQFKLLGTVTGYADSTIVCMTNGQHNDSTYLINSKFSFTDTLSVNERHIMVSIKKSPDFKFFWVERSNMTLTGKKGDFRQAQITGSNTQLEDDELQAIIKPLRKATQTDDKAAYTAAQAKIYDEYCKFIQRNPASIIGPEFLSVFSPAIGLAKAKQMYGLLTPKIKNTPQGKKVLKFITYNKDVKVGQPFADFTQYGPDGKPVKLSDFKGHVTLLDFWASWCVTCRHGHPALINTYNVYKNNGFKIVAVSIDNNKADWLAAIKQNKLPYTNVSEKNGGENIANLIYGIDKYPSNYLIDESGTIVGQDLSSEELCKALMRL